MLQSLLPGPVETVLSGVAAWILTYAATSTVLLGAAWGLDGRTSLTRSPAARSRLWTAAVLGSVLAATVQVAVGVGPRVGFRASEAEKVVAEFRAAPTERSAVPGELDPAHRAASGAPVLHEPHAADRLDPVAWARSLGHDWPFLLALLWLTGALLLLARRAGRWGHLGRRLRSRRTIRAGPLRRVLDQVMDDARLEGPVRLSRTPALAGPVVLPSGEICVPERVEAELEPEEQRALLAHEVAHLVRKDPRTVALLGLVESLFFFQPLNALARRRVEDAAERLSDDRVRELGLGSALAGTLVTVARWVRADGRATHVAGLAGSSDLDGIEGRVRRLIHDDPPAPRAAARALPILPAVACLAAVSMALPAADVRTPGHASTIVARAGAPPGDWARSTVLAPAGPDALPAGLDALARGPGTGLRVRLTTDGPATVSLRPGGEDVRLVAPDGRSTRLSLPTGTDGEGRVAVLDARPDAPTAGDGTGRFELFLPDRVRRLALRVNGRWLSGRDAPSGGELPRVVSPR